MELENAVGLVCHWLEEKNCILFLGAGFSAGKPGSKEGVLSTQELKKALGTDPTEDLSLFLQHKFGAGGLHLELEKYFNCNKSERRPKKEHRIVARLPFHIIITTNCDNLQEEAYDEVWRNYSRVVLDEDLPKVGVCDATLVKPHGCVLEQRDDVYVFSSAQYSHFETNRPYLKSWLSTVLATYHVVYVGYGLNDENLLRALSEGLTSSGLFRGTSTKPMSIAVMGDSPEAGFHRFGSLCNIQQVQATAETFMSYLEEKFNQYSERHRKDPVTLLRKILEVAPSRFIRNCQMASLGGTFPLDLLKWEIREENTARTPGEKEKAREAQKCFQEIFSQRLIEPVMKFGEQWFRFQPDVADFFLSNINPRDEPSNLGDIPQNYWNWVYSKMAR
ncbi:MAG: SIR2 family protein [Acidobacteriota bacterium]|nr:SIR2 family protein [Acidobacteriota bacterium]